MPYKDPEAKRRNRREYYLKNREKCLSDSREWAAANPERIREIGRKSALLWKKNHPEASKEAKRRTYLKYADKWAAQEKRYQANHKKQYQGYEKARKLRLRADPELSERRRVGHRKYYQRNREVRIASVIKYREMNLEKTRQWSRVASSRRRARLVEDKK